MLVALTAYWLIFWQKFLRNPYLLCTSEVASTYFPRWRWLGKNLFKPDVYYKYPACIPFLSNFYLPNLLTSWVGARLRMDLAFRAYTWLILGHYLVGSFVAYWMFSQWASPLVSLFGAVTLTYSGYNIKPQTPASAFTCCWIPGLFLGGHVGVLSFGMLILSGYYPPLLYILPVAFLLHPEDILGLFFGIPQLICFLWYWPRSIRAGQLPDRKFGCLSFFKLLDLFIPTKSVALTNGVHYPEVAMYMGLAPLFIWHLSWWWLVIAYACAVLVGILPSVQRIPARAIYLLTFCLTVLACQVIEAFSHNQILGIVFLQLALIFYNSSIYPSFPFSQWWDKPSRLYAKHPFNGTWPNVTGYLINKKISNYAGAFRLKEAACAT